jgi:NitT/TauT family transport system substrate-binding protein
MKKSGSFILGMIGFTVLVLALSANIPQATAADDGVVRYSTEPTSLGIPYWLAKERGLFKKHGLKKTKDTMGHTALVGLKAIGSGQLDISFQSDPPTIANISKGIDAIIVAATAQGNQSMKLVAIKSITNPKQLIGKKVTWMGGTGGEYGFIKFLQNRGIDYKKLDHVNLPPPEAVPTLAKGGVEALWFWEPWPRKVLELKTGKFHILAASKAADYEPNFHLTVRRGFAKDKPETLKRFLRALIEATDLANKDRAAASAVYRKVTRSTAADAKASLGDYNLRIWMDKDYFDTLQEVSEFKKKLGHIKAIPNWRNIVNPTFLRAVDASKVKNFPY